MEKNEQREILEGIGDVTVIIPVHELKGEEEAGLLGRALCSVQENRESYSHGKLPVMIACPKSEIASVKSAASAFEKESGGISYVINDGETDFCSQVNCAAAITATPHFSILEFDDYYALNWFEMQWEYTRGNTGISVFLPIHVMETEDQEEQSFANELVWAASFSDELGFIDYDCLQNCSAFNLSGGTFNLADFKEVGMFKPSIRVAFMYELLLRMTNKKMPVFVVPKEGYRHLIGRKGSLTDIYAREIPSDEIQQWFLLAKQECFFTEDRHMAIPTKKKTEEPV